MERSVAIKKLGKILGKSLGYRVDPKGLRADEREQAEKEARILSEQYKAVAMLLSARQHAILEADAEYQRLKAKTKELGKAKDEAWSRSRRYRFTVGVSNNLFFTVRAQGDSWEDVIAQLTKSTA